MGNKPSTPETVAVEKKVENESSLPFPFMEQFVSFSISEYMGNDQSKYIIFILAVMIRCNETEKLALIEFINEGNFLNFFLCRLKHMTEIQIKFSGSYKFTDSGIMLLFLSSLTDKSKFFCEKLLENEDFISVVRNIVNTDKRILEPFKVDISIIINNIFFQTDCETIGDLDLKVFLLKRVSNKNEGLQCIFTLLRISNEEEIMRFENEICLVLKKFMCILKEIVDKLDASPDDEIDVQGFGLEELLKQLKPFTKCRKAKMQLTNDISFRNICIKMIRDNKFSRYLADLGEILPLFFTEREIDQMKNE